MADETGSQAGPRPAGAARDRPPGAQPDPRRARPPRGPLRAADVARELGIPANQASFHLRQLAKYGLVEEAPEEARDRRDRVWRRLDRLGDERQPHRARGRPRRQGGGARLPRQQDGVGAPRRGPRVRHRPPEGERGVHRGPTTPSSSPTRRPTSSARRSTTSSRPGPSGPAGATPSGVPISCSSSSSPTPRPERCPLAPPGARLLAGAALLPLATACGAVPTTRPRPTPRSSP